MQFFLDTEFLDDAAGTRLISVGVVAMTGAEFYAISSDILRADIAGDAWLAENVLPHLDAPDAPDPVPNAVIAQQLAAFCREHHDGREPHAWAWNGAYDFYLLARLYGGYGNIPADVPRRFSDLKQWARQSGNVSVPAQSAGVHDALADARYNRDTFNWLRQHDRDRDQAARRRTIGQVREALTESLNGLMR